MLVGMIPAGKGQNFVFFFYNHERYSNEILDDLMQRGKGATLTLCTFILTAQGNSTLNEFASSRNFGKERRLRQKSFGNYSLLIQKFFF